MIAFRGMSLVGRAQLSRRKVKPVSRRNIVSRSGASLQFYPNFAAISEPCIYRASAVLGELCLVVAFIKMASASFTDNQPVYDKPREYGSPTPVGRMLWVAAAFLMLHWCAPSFVMSAIESDSSYLTSLRTAEYAQPFVQFDVGRRVAAKLPQSEKNYPSSVGKKSLTLAKELQEANPYGLSQRIVSSDDAQKALRDFRTFDARGPPGRA